MSALVRESQALKKTVIGIGVALCVAPFFVSAQSNDSSRMLLEMQSMRQEIAELRDMVERQQYELRKLQNPPRRPGPPAVNESVSRDPGESDGQPVQGAYTSDGSLPAEGSYSTEGTRPADGSYPAEGSNRLPAPGAGANESGWATNNIPNNAPTAPSQSTAAGDRSAYDRPFENAGNGAPVSESPIDVPPVQGGSSYPPVVDRSIGSSAENEIGSRAQEGINAATVPTKTQNPNVAQGTDPYRNNPNPSSRPINEAPVNPASRPQEIPSNTAANAPFVDGGGVIAVPRADANTGSAALSEQDYYQQGFELLKKSEHEEAVSVFEQQIKAYPQGEYADDAYYWIAESMYVNRKLDESKANFKAIIDGYRQSTRLPDALLKTAYIEQEQGNVIEARILLQEIMQFHPSSNAAISAKNRLADLK